MWGTLVLERWVWATHVWGGPSQVSGRPMSVAVPLAPEDGGVGGSRRRVISVPGEYLPCPSFPITSAPPPSPLNPCGSVFTYSGVFHIYAVKVGLRDLYVLSSSRFRSFNGKYSGFSLFLIILKYGINCSIFPPPPCCLPVAL